MRSSRRRQLACALIIAHSAVAGACSYRYTNLRTELPGGIRRVAVESIYDTSHVVFPHEILWEEMQMELGRKGSLHVVGRDDADAILRLHVTDGAVGVAPESIKAADTGKDPNIYDGADPEIFDTFRRLPQAGRFASNEIVSYSVHCELWDTRSSKLLKQFNVSGAAGYTAIRNSEIVRAESNYIRAEEAQEGAFRQVARSLAGTIVSRLIVER